MKPEDRNTMLDILFESTIAINEWLSFEAIFAWKGHPIIKDDIEKLYKLLPNVYIRALLLLSHIQKSCDKSGFESRRRFWWPKHDLGHVVLIFASGIIDERD
jgi:hypothetical protein